MSSQRDFNKEHTHLNMLRNVKLIKQLPHDITKQLRQVGDFYICTQFTRGVVGDPVVKIGGDIYYRFMNFIYLPQPPENLTAEQVVEICDLRLEYINELVDQNHNRRVVAAMVSRLSPNLFEGPSLIDALDFGCGSGLSSKFLLEHIPNVRMVGIDISKRAILESRKQSLVAFLTCPKEPLPFKTQSFDVIFAVFVMHFKIDKATLVELRRVLRTPGRFLFNIYQRNTDNVIEELRDAGFCSIEIWNGLFSLGKNYIIVSCGLTQPYGVVFHQVD